MHDAQIQNRFVELRSRGWSYERIARELSVAKQTLINWSRKHQFEIQNLRAIELESLKDQLISTAEARARILAGQLAKVEGELAKRDLTQVSTSRLFSLAASLRAQIFRETDVEPKFTSPLKEIPEGEYNEQVQDWTA